MKQMCRLILGSFLLCVTLTVNAYSTATVNGITWKYEVINGAASLYGEFTLSGGYSYAYPAIPQTTKGAVSIPASLGGYAVKRIGNYAFYNCTNMTRIVIPHSVTNIGMYAFFACRGLTGVTIPDNVTSIEGSAFSGCNGLTSATIPYGVRRIGGAAFSGCSGLTSMTIPDSVTNIEGNVFEGCSGLGGVTMSDNVYSIGNAAFRGCSSLTNIVLPNCLTGIGSYAFQNCGLLTDMTIPDGVININDYTFSGCTNLVSVTIPNGVTNLGSQAFAYCTNLTSIVIPSSVNIRSGYWYAFSGCNNLTSVTVPPSACTNKFSQLFPQSYTAITNVVIADGTTIIGVYACSNCVSLTHLKMPSSVKSIGGNAFYGCGSLKDVTIPQCACSSTMATVFPAGYKSITNLVVTASATEISQRCFSGCGSLESVLLPASMTSVRAYAFENCSSLESVRFLGDAPDTGGTVYYGTPRSMVTYVPKGSSGWQRGVSSDLPETWPLGDSTARAIKYWDGNATATPVVTPGDGMLFEGTCEVSLSCATDGARIYYTTNGTTPRLVERNLYLEPFAIGSTVHIKAIAVAEGLDQSLSATATLTKVDQLSLPLAIGAGGNLVTTDGDAVWAPVAVGTAPNGEMAARSGAIGEDGMSWMETTVIGAGTLSFWWRVSCVKDLDGTATWDYLMCEVDGKEIGRIDGETEWAKQEVVFKTAGRHTIRWTYVKDSYLDEGDFEDCAWVQGLDWLPESESGEALYTRDQIHSLALGNLVIDVDNASQTARIGIRLKSTADLGEPDWKDVPLSINDLDIGEDGTVGLNVPATGNAAFYKVVAGENQ